MPSSCVSAALLWPSAIHGSGALFVRGPKGLGGEQVPQLSCLSLCVAVRLPGAGAGRAFPSKKPEHSGPASASSAQLVSVLFGSAGHNLGRQEVQASSLGGVRKGHSLGPLLGQLVLYCLNASLG